LNGSVFGEQTSFHYLVKPHFTQEVETETTPSLDKAQMTLTLVLRWRWKIGYWQG